MDTFNTYWLLLFAHALFNTGWLHHDARQILQQEKQFESRSVNDILNKSENL